jgi:hypothetical protein
MILAWYVDAASQLFILSDCSKADDGCWRSLCFQIFSCPSCGQVQAVAAIVQDSVGEKSIGTLASVAIDTRGPRQ